MKRFRRDGGWVQGGIPCIHEGQGLLAYAVHRGEISISTLSGVSMKTIRLDSLDRAVALQFSQDGNVLVAATYQGDIEVWSLKGDVPRRVAIFHAMKEAKKLAVTNDGTLVLVATETKVLLYSAELGDALQTIDVVQGPITGMHFHERGFVLVENEHLIERHLAVLPKSVLV